MPARSQTALTLGFIIVSCWADKAQAQDCGCDHMVEPTTPTINGADMGVAPGEVVCISGGPREFLRIYEMVGTEDAPIVIKNCGGVVDIDNADRGYGLTLEGSSFVQITGTGDASAEHGFRVRASRTGPDYSASCVIANGRSTDYELDHIEAYECGFAGVSAKTDPTCDERDLSDFVQRNSRLHHLYLHDTHGEGIYFGSTGFPSRSRNCDGTDVDLIPHSHEGVYIHDNLIEDTGWDGAQVGVSTQDCFIYRNRIARVGLEREQYQMQGLQIGSSACEIFDNYLAHGEATGIIVLDSGSNHIYNNVIVDFVDGIYINDRDSETAEGARYRVDHNTVVDAKDRGITIFGSRTSQNTFLNNLIVQGGMSPLGIGNEVDATDEGNVILDAVADAFFVDAAGEDYSLDTDSPAIDAGVSGAVTEVDWRSAPRDEMPDAGAHEFGAEPPDDAEMRPAPGDSPSTGNDSTDDASTDDGAGGATGGDESDEGESSSSSDEDGGCSCTSGATGAPGSTERWLLFGLALAMLSIRRSNAFHRARRIP